MKNLQTYTEFINESTTTFYYHGTPDARLIGKHGIHVGTYEAATQALEARIGVPSKGVWDGKRIYGKTLLAGKKTLEKIAKQRNVYSLITGINCHVPEEDYYPNERSEIADYSDGTKIPLTCKPIILKVKIVGRMTNTPMTPHDDFKANGYIMRQLKKGNAKSGYYYTNIGEDAGSISAVVPNLSFLEIIK